ncbi:MAG: CDP-glycerol glycerophosphotransferase family protein [Desulfobacteraceae bacterium]|nr:CDP-glycerol glycerophosphotransferase family protein [Desulfobacteraceae bacterium]
MLKETYIKYKIGYYTGENIQHLTPLLLLYSHLGGIFYIYKNKDTYDYLREKYSHLNINIYFSNSINDIKKEVRQSRIRLMIYSDYSELDLVKSIQVFHECGDKNYSEHPKIVKYDLSFLAGDKIKDKLEQLGILKKLGKWEMTGYPKLDPVMSNKLIGTRKKVFDNHRKTILYAPTVLKERENEHEYSSVPLWTKKVITSLYKKYNIIIKYHGIVRRESQNIYEQIDSLIIKLDAEGSVRLIIDDNIVEYMVQSDLVITDISSVAYEWFHFNKPILFVNPAPMFFIKSDDIFSNLLSWQAGDVLENENELLQYVEKNLTTDEYKTARNELFHYTIYKPDGKALDRQIKQVLKLYKQYAKKSYLWFFVSCYLLKRLKHIKYALMQRHYNKYVTISSCWKKVE